jgi:hypothetical protein
VFGTRKRWLTSGFIAYYDGERIGGFSCCEEGSTAGAEERLKEILHGRHGGIGRKRFEGDGMTSGVNSGEACVTLYR